jgi:hypothetical protein
MLVEGQQNTANGLIWAGAALVSGSTTVGSGLLTALLMSTDKLHFSHSQITNPFKFNVDINVSTEARAVLMIGTLALGVLTAKCYEQMAAHLGLSHKVTQQ